jgi:DNA replication initiation complex subunit (GINS family)
MSTKTEITHRITHRITETVEVDKVEQDLQESIAMRIGKMIDQSTIGHTGMPEEVSDGEGRRHPIPV